MAQRGWLKASGAEAVGVFRQCCILNLTFCVAPAAGRGPAPCAAMGKADLGHVLGLPGICGQNGLLQEREGDSHRANNFSYERVLRSFSVISDEELFSAVPFRSQRPLAQSLKKTRSRSSMHTSQLTLNVQKFQAMLFTMISPSFRKTLSCTMCSVSCREL